METELIFEGDLGGVFNTETETETDQDHDHDHTISVHHEEVETVETEVSVDGMQLGLEGIQEEAQQIIVEEDTLANTIDLLPPEALIVNPPEPELSQEDQLKSTERLDRSSPDLWPQNLPTAALHLLARNQPKTGGTDRDNLGIWAQGLDPEDINLLHQFGSLTSSSLVEEVKKLQNIAYQLGLEEAKEMTRGKLLHVLDETGCGYNNNAKQQEKESHVQRLWK